MPQRGVARKPALRKPAVRKKTTRKHKPVVRKATARKRMASKSLSHKLAVRKPAQRLVRARRSAFSAAADDYRIIRDTLKEVIATQKKSATDIAKNNAKTNAAIDKTNAKINAAIDKTNAAIDKTNATVAKTSATVAELSKSIGGLNGKWGDFAEALLVGEVDVALNSIKGIKVTERHPHVEVEYEGKTWEIDCLAVGEDVVVVVEAKSSLREGHVGKFIGNIMQRFIAMMPAYRGRKIYGAIGYLNAKKETVAFAQSKGLLVLRSIHKTKEVVSLPSKFKLRDFHP